MVRLRGLSKVKLSLVRLSWVMSRHPLVEIWAPRSSKVWVMGQEKSLVKK